MRFLHIGCGPATKLGTTRHFASDGWNEVRFDIDPDVRPDLIGTMTDMTAVETGGFDALYSSHNIEHLYPHEVSIALAEFFRVLNNQGYVVITCPDLQSVCELIAEGKLLEPAYQSPAGPISPLDIIYGHRDSLAAGNLYMAHKTGFTIEVLCNAVGAAGFKSIIGFKRGAPAFDLFCIASKTKLSEEKLKGLRELHYPGK